MTAPSYARPLRLGMVGGGAGAFIGPVHRLAARLDGKYELVAGALSSRPEVARDSGLALGLVPDRIYTDYLRMAEIESARPDGIEVVSIVTPNHLHHEQIVAFLEAGISVICDKPVTTTLAEAQALRLVQPARNARFLLTHTYTGYPMARMARQLVAAGALGSLRVVQVEYCQDWLATGVENENRQASWRTDPAQAGAGGCISDIGTHAWQLLRYVSGLHPLQIAADLSTHVPGRRVDDNVQAMLRFENGARGALWASQVATGRGNSLRLRLYGDQASLEWDQESPETMRYCPLGQPPQILSRGGHLPEGQQWQEDLRLPQGHPEGYIEAFATLYSQFHAELTGTAGPGLVPLPGLADGIDVMTFVETALTSHRAGGAWIGWPWPESSKR